MLHRLITTGGLGETRRRGIGVGGAFLPAGDQGVFSEASTAWDGLEAAPWFGNRYDPGADTWASGTAWLTLDPSRYAASGAFYLPETAASATVHAILRGGTNTAKLRAIVYAQNATANNLTSVDYITDGALPNTRAAFSTAELTVTAGAAAGERSVALSTGMAAGNYFLGFWSDTAATGAQVWYLSNGVAGRCRTNLNDPNAVYSAVNPPAATWPTFQTASKHEWSIWLTYTPVAPTAPTLLSVTAPANRTAVLTWANNDARTTRVRVERSKNGGAYVAAAVVEGTSYTDPDLQAGASYTYRLVSCYKNAASTASGTATVVANGVRIATPATTFVQLADTVNVHNSGRGLQGSQITISGQTQHEKYKRTDFEWANLEPTEGNYNFSAITSFLNGLSATQRGHIRVRATLPDTTGTLPAYIKATGNWAIADGGEHPDYRNSYVRGRAVALATALGATFEGDARLVFLDMGFVGPYGEWGGPSAYTFAVSDLSPIIDALTAAFPSKFMYMTAATAPYGGDGIIAYALAKSNVRGLRFDSAGDDDAPSPLQRVWGQRSATNRVIIRNPRFSVLTELKSSWSPSIAANDVTRLEIGIFNAENLSGYSALSGSDQALLQAAWRACGFRLTFTAGSVPTHLVRGQAHPVRLDWRNLGNRAPIEAWPIEYQLRSGGSVVSGCRFTSALDVRNLLPSAGATGVSDTITVPTGTAPGTYQLCVEGPARASGRVPALELAVNLTRAGSSYVLGNVEVS